MKVNDVGSSKSVAGPRRKKEAAGSGGAFAQQLKDATSASDGAVGETHGVSAASSILAVQEVSDATDGRSRGLARQYGDDILDRLDSMRLKILEGTLTKDQLAELAQTMRAKRVRSDDPKLNAIIDEIELRAEIEIAKLTRNV